MLIDIREEEERTAAGLPELKLGARYKVGHKRNGRMFVCFLQMRCVFVPLPVLQGLCVTLPPIKGMSESHPACLSGRSGSRQADQVDITL